MPILLTCRCKTTFDVPDAFAGKSSMCPECGAFLDVPELNERPAAARRRAVESEAEDEPREEHSPRELKRLVRDAFTGEIKPVRRTVGYRLALAFVACAMLALPALYVGLVVGIAVVVFWHVTTNYTLFRDFGFWPGAVLYVGPPVAGLVLLGFLIKPLLARPSRTRRGRSIRLDKEPVLAAFVAEVAQAAHAPEPDRIEVNCEVNAAAGFGSGLTGLFGHHLTLTIGLPLVAGLTAREFAGILAHEFGHFAQGAGMRVSYIVRTVNAWFERIVFERDSWDEAVNDWSRDSGWAGVVALLVWGGVLATRCVLGVFMIAGHGLSCFLMRRMEYDADRSEARLAGAKTFEKTSRRMAVLDKAFEEATEIVEGCWVKDRFPDDFPALVVGLADGMSRGDARDVLDELEDARTGLFDTHPSFTDRLASVQREDARGVCRLDLPAADLFRDLPKLAEGASLDHYRGLFGGGIQPTLRPVREYLGRRDS